MFQWLYRTTVGNEKTNLSFTISFTSSIFVFVSGQFENTASSNQVNDIFPQVYNINLSNFMVYSNRANSEGFGQNGLGYLFIGI